MPTHAASGAGTQAVGEMNSKNLVVKIFWVRTLEEGRDRASGPGRRRSRGTHSVHKGDGERAKEKEGVYLP